MTYAPRHALACFTATAVLIMGIAGAGEYSHTGFYALDGDTVIIRETGERVRLHGVDAPEIHPCHCPSECELGQRAKTLAQQLLDRGPVTISRIELDRYGRTVAAVDVGGVDLGASLIAAGVARPYHYPNRRRPWC